MRNEILFTISKFYLYCLDPFVTWVCLKIPKCVKTSAECRVYCIKFTISSQVFHAYTIASFSSPLILYYSLDNFRNRQRSPLRTLCRSIDCQSVPPSHRRVNKHRRAAAIFSYFSLSFPDTLSRRRRISCANNHSPSGAECL